MTRLKKIRGPRPDPTPDVAPAGYVLNVTGLSSTSECLDQGERTPYRKTTLEMPMAHLPGKLPKNITDLTEKARKMEHGLKHPNGPSAAEVIFPLPMNPLLEERERRRERIYHRREHKVLGRSIHSESNLPEVTKHPEFRFGMPTIEDDTAKEIMYPPTAPGSDSENGARSNYIISHRSYLPGERRRHYGPGFEVPQSGIETGRQYYNNDGNRVKEVLYSTVSRSEELQTKLVSKRLADWQESRRPQIGKVHDPIRDTIAHLPPDHTFGVRFPPDDYTICDLISGKKRDGRKTESPEDVAAVATQAQSMTLTADQMNGRRAKMEHKKLMDEIVPKITSSPVGGIRPRRYAHVPESAVFGIPTVRERKHGVSYIKKLADDINYGDELDAKSLLLPTPRNIYGDDLINELRRQLHTKDEEDPDPASTASPGFAGILLPKLLAVS